MDALAGFFQALLFLLGLVEQEQITRHDCEQLWSSGYVVYPLTAEQRANLDRCHELQQEQADEN